MCDSYIKEKPVGVQLSQEIERAAMQSTRTVNSTQSSNLAAYIIYIIMYIQRHTFYCSFIFAFSWA